MKKQEKGKPGYIDSQKKERLIIIVAGLITIVADFVTGLILTKTRNNYFTVVAILLALPVGKTLASYLALFRHHSAPMVLVEKIEAQKLIYPVLYDCVMTSSQKIMGIDAVVIGPDFISAYSRDTQLDKKYFEETLTAFVREGKMQVKVSLFLEEKAFFARLNQLKAHTKALDDAEKERIERVAASVKAMCL